jgi:outer membrane protein OmpA-like peptidoglycan-associated protein/tetratricopeptide (TPR) repeat protein
MKGIKKIAFILLLVYPMVIIGQDKRADKLFKSEDYKGALSSYLKTFEKEPNNGKVAAKIGECYLNLQDYLIASEYFSEASRLMPDEEEYQIDYAEALIYAMEIDRAELFISDYLAENPDSKDANRLLETCSHIKVWEEIKDEFIVVPMLNINSPYDDFGPAVFKDNLVFTSNRFQDLKDFQGVNSQQDRKTNLYIAEFDNNEKTRFEKPEIFLPFLDESNNQGPISFTKFGKKAFFNSTGISAEKIGKKLTLKIFEMDNSMGEWSKPEGISINNNAYSVYHPFISEDGEYLFYVSDRPGGFGGMDIYYSTKESGVWGIPKNLGPKINTSEDDVFPTFNDGILYYSTKGKIGYGGLDVFEVDNFRDPEVIRNMGYPINSSSDDFQFVYRTRDAGYFVSDRPGGMGGDDLFAFKKQELNRERTTIAGQVTFDRVPARNARVDLLDQGENVLQTSISDEVGRFQFNAVGVHSIYEVKINLNGSGVTEDVKLGLLNSKGEKVVAIFPDEDERLFFEALPADDYNNLKPIDLGNSLLTVDLRGHIYKEFKGDINERVSLYVLNPDNQVMARGFTDTEGSFEFKRLPPEEYYTLKPSKPIPGINIVILGEGDEVIVLRENETKDEFLYLRLSPDEDYITLLNEDGFPVKIKMNESFQIDNIYYSLDSYEINDAAQMELDKLALIMLNNDQLKIKLLSHTDSRDSDDHNLKLSQKRADFAKSYLVNKGVGEERVIAIGMGESQIVNHCKDQVPCSEKEHAVNRRTEFEIIDN